ncbi:MAG: lipopolysaccharide biosynthesis protein [Solirubrobacteraceae bacterium]
MSSLRRRYEPRLATLRASDTAKAAGLAVAMIANNVIALGSTFVFARLLGDNYGRLAALISYLLILTVAGQAMQVATAREGVLGHLGTGDVLLATMRTWSRTMFAVTAVLTVASIVLRQPIADAVGVKHYPWAAAVGLPAGCLYLEVSLLRGALQGIGDYRSVGYSLVGEQATRLVLGAVLAVAGLSVTGAYIGSFLSYVAMSMYCWFELHRRVYGPDWRPSRQPRPAKHDPAFKLWPHVKRAWAPIAGLIVIAVLQNIDIIVANHQFTKHDASSYSAVAVAAKVLIWVAMGAGFYLVPEVSRRRAHGEDTRPVLAAALGVTVVCAVPVLLIFAFASEPLIRIAFGAGRASAHSALLPLGAAFTVLAGTYLAIQYMLALKRTWFLVAVAAVAVAEPLLLLQASRKPTEFATVVLAVQIVGALLAFGIALRRQKPPPLDHDERKVRAVEPELVGATRV